LSEEELLPTCGPANAIIQNLQNWKDTLPRHLKGNSDFLIIPRQRRNVLFLHIYFHHIICIVTRPYILAKVSRDIERQSHANSPGLQPINATIEALSQECRNSAYQVSDLMQQLASNSLLEGTLWFDFFYLQHAMLVMSLAFLGSQQDTGSESAMDSAHRAAVTSLIRLCETTRLAPTYSILCHVAVSFARIVGIDTDDVSSQDEDDQVPTSTIGHRQRNTNAIVIPYQQMQQQMQTQQSRYQGQPFFQTPLDPRAPVMPEFFSDWYQFGPELNALPDTIDFGINDMQWDFFDIQDLNDQRRNDTSWHTSQTDPLSLGYGGSLGNGSTITGGWTD
jgi:hypothetical protein